MQMMTRISVNELDDALNAQITKLSSMPDPDLHALEQAIERAYIHVLIERALRSPQPQESRVSRLVGRLRTV